MEYKEFRCELCDTGYRTLALANKCEKKCAALKKSILEEELKTRNSFEYPRLNAKTIPEFIRMIRDEVRMNIKKCQDYKLTYSGIYFVNDLSYRGKPFDAVYEQGKSYPGFMLEYTASKIDSGQCIFGTDVTSKFGLHSGCGNGVNNNMMRYQSHIFLDDLPLVKEAIQKNEDEKKKYAAVVAEMNVKYVKEHMSDDYVPVKQKDIDKAYAKYQKLRLDLKRYESDVYGKPAKEEFDSIPKPVLIDIGCPPKYDLVVPTPYCPN